MGESRPPDRTFTHAGKRNNLGDCREVLGLSATRRGLLGSSTSERESTAAAEEALFGSSLAVESLAADKV
jgi:hypothetical protein